LNIFQLAAMKGLRIKGTHDILSLVRPQCLAIVLAIGLASCAQAGDRPAAPTPTAAPAAAGPLAITTIAKGSDTEYGTKPEDVVVRDAAAWKTLWEKANAALVPQPALPAVDFAKECVIAVFAGEKKSTGHAVEVAKVEATAAGLVVTVRETAPKAGSMTGAALTYPFHIVRVPSTAAKVEFRREK
jgi:hypothetical protein